MSSDLSGITVPYLKAWRVSRVWSQEELAAKAGVTPATISRLESGGKVRFSTVAKLAEAFGLSREQLLNTKPGRAAA